MVAISAAALLNGCSTVEMIPPASPSLDLYDPLDQQSDAAPAEDANDADQKQAGTTDAATQKNKLIYYKGRTGSLSSLGAVNQDRLEGRMLQLNFVDAPASDAARTVIRDALGETVSVADGVTGIITLTSPAPVPAREALNALELALAESNLALIDSGGGFLLTTIQNARETPQSPGRRAAIGYSTTIAPIKFGIPSEIVQLIEPFLNERITLTPDDTEGAIIVRGPTIDANEALEAIETFDAPYLTDRVFGLFKIDFADVETIRNEIQSVLNASGVTTGNGAALIALPRLNLLFVSARSSEGFAEIRSWVERFDQPSGGDERRIRYYPVQYTPADALANQINAAFGVASVNYGSPANNTGEQSQNIAPQPRISSSNRDNVSITPDTLNNALLIRATDQEYAEILNLIRMMDMPAAQVLIEATIAEVTLTEDLSFGVRWFFENAESDLQFSDNGSLGPVFPGLNYSYFDNNVGVALNTLASLTDVTVLSAPSIVVLNNQSANLQVGDEVPIVTQQAQSVVDGDAPIVSTLQLRETGVILEVTPRINASDVVVIDITQEVSDVAPTTTSGIDSPTIQQRRFTSTVSVKDKGTVLLGGLIRENYTDSSSGVPVLKDIPLLGYAFKSRDVTKRRTELLVFLTPHIIRNESDAHAAFKELRRKLHNLYNDPPEATN